MNIDQKRVKDFAINAGFLTKPEAEKLYKESIDQNIAFSEYLLNRGVLSEDSVRRIHGHVLGIPFIDLSQYQIPFDILSIIPEPIARNHNIVAFNRNNETLEVMLIDLNDLDSIEFVKEKYDVKILPRLSTVESIKSALLQYHKGLKDRFGDVIRKEQSVMKMVDTLIRHAVIQSATDIHIEPNENEMVIRYRIGGRLKETMILPRSNTISAYLKEMANLVQEEGLPQYGKFKGNIDGENISFGVSVFPVLFGEKIVIKILKEGGSKYSFEELGLRGEGLENMYDAIRSKKGLIITTGPKGSGRTTTNYTILDILNKPDTTISTIEDPIEYQIARVNQTQVRNEIDLDFANGLRALLKQDPDIVMVSELNNSETTNLAINTAITGRLVISSLYANSSSLAIEQLIHTSEDLFMLSSSLNLVIAQRTVRKLSEKKEKYYLSKAGLESLKKSVDLDKVMKTLVQEKIIKKGTSWSDVPFFKPKASNGNDGFDGKVGIYEVLKVSESIKEMILKGKKAEEINEQAKKEGMNTLVEDGIVKAVQGLTTIEEVLKSIF